MYQQGVRKSSSNLSGGGISVLIVLTNLLRVLISSSEVLLAMQESDSICHISDRSKDLYSIDMCVCLCHSACSMYA